jgi:hypothetical protein
MLQASRIISVLCLTADWWLILLPRASASQNSRFNLRSQRRGLHSPIFVLPVEEDISVTSIDGRPWTVKCFLWLHISVGTISRRGRNVLYRIQWTTWSLWAQAVCSSSQNSIPSTEFFSGMLTSLHWEKPKCNRKFTVSSHGEREMNSSRYTSMSQYTVKIRETQF